MAINQGFYIVHKESKFDYNNYNRVNINDKYHRTVSIKITFQFIKLRRTFILNTPYSVRENRTAINYKIFTIPSQQ